MMRYMTVAVITESTLAEKNCFTFEEMEDAVNEAAIAAAMTLLPVEVYVLLHDHDPTPDDDCSCADYLRPAGPYITFNQQKEVLEKD